MKTKAIIVKALPASPTRAELYAKLMGRYSETLRQQVLPDAEMRRHGYSEKAIRSS